MLADHLCPRFAESGLVEALADTPVVLIHGPRQCGKATLAGMAGQKRSYAYFGFDDDLALAAATADPVGFVGDLPERVILDEVQRAPGVFSTVRPAVDRRRVPGRFLLTGSANVLPLPTLAGRMGILRLHAGASPPGKLARAGDPWSWDRQSGYGPTRVSIGSESASSTPHLQPQHRRLQTRSNASAARAPRPL